MEGKVLMYFSTILLNSFFSYITSLLSLDVCATLYKSMFIYVYINAYKNQWCATEKIFLIMCGELHSLTNMSFGGFEVWDP